MFLNKQFRATEGRFIRAQNGVFRKRTSRPDSRENVYNPTRIFHSALWGPLVKTRKVETLKAIDVGDARNKIFKRPNLERGKLAGEKSDEGLHASFAPRTHTHTLIYIFRGFSPTRL